MRGWLVAMGALAIGIIATGAATAAPLECGLPPTVKCLAAEVFALAKTLPDDDRSGLRREADFAERELSPGDAKTALEYVVADIPDPSPWDDISWIAQAGLLDKAMSLARQRKTPVERLGGLLAVATGMLEKNDKAGATKIVEEVERELPSIAADDSDDYGSILPIIAAEIRVRLGQMERVAPLVGTFGATSIDTLLSFAGKYPAAAGLREEARRQAELLNDPFVWRRVLEDAVERGDQADITRTAQLIGRRTPADVPADKVGAEIALARALLKTGFPDPAADLIRPWAQWIKEKDARKQLFAVNALIPVLAGLARDRDVELAINAVNSFSDRSECLGRAAAEYFRIGRNDAARKFDLEALRMALLSPIGDPDLQSRHNGALHNLALIRADHGDIDGALDAAGKLPDAARISEVTSYIIRRAVDNGHGPVAGPAIKALEEQASAAWNPGLSLQAAKAWYDIGEEEMARRSLARTMKAAEQRQSPLAADNLGVAAELMWRIDGQGRAQAMLDIADKLQVNDTFAIDHLVEIVRPVSPAVALQLARRQVDLERRITELANIGIEIAGAK